MIFMIIVAILASSCRGAPVSSDTEDEENEPKDLVLRDWIVIATCRASCFEEVSKSLNLFNSTFKNYKLLFVNYALIPYLCSVLYFITIIFPFQFVSYPPSDEECVRADGCLECWSACEEVYFSKRYDELCHKNIDDECVSFNISKMRTAQD